MRVITLDNEALVRACRQLVTKVCKSFDPDVIVGIATGGDRVGRLLFTYMQKAKPMLMYVEASASRPGTKSKKRALLSLFPRVILDALRKFESWWLRLFPGTKERNFSMNPPKNVSELLSSHASRVLIVDDALDSGTTLRCAYDYIDKNFPGCEIRTAVLTITNPSPDMEADYYLYNDCVLIRFPWSNDMKQ